MRFLLDQDVYFLTARFLKSAGHNVVLVSEIGLATAQDEEILSKAQKEKRILITRDRDYGNLVFVQRKGSGVIYLRILPTTVNAVHHQLNKVIENYSQGGLEGAFVVVEANGYRFRKPFS